MAELEASTAAYGADPRPHPAAAGETHRASGRGAATFAPTWVMLDDAEPRRARLWLYACIGAGMLLALQMTHHTRRELATLAGIGPVVQSTYALLGGHIAPAWDLAAYEIIVDWNEHDAVGADEPQLRIAASVRNRGSRRLPMPHIQVQLKDRWESTIGSRIFTPAEYLQSGAAHTASIGAGHSARAELALVDPGPEAYGFELDVCIAADAGMMRCASSEVYR